MTRAAIALTAFALAASLAAAPHVRAQSASAPAAAVVDSSSSLRSLGARRRAQCGPGHGCGRTGVRQ